MSYNLNLSDTSFTNKDFNDVYPELLDEAKKLSYKWDPTISNESDPGVTLIKEIALALDKINYASDKNALESMPLSVTQDRTSRQLFQLLGYYPKWYISSEVTVSLAWKIDRESEEYNLGRSIKIPAFTQIRDDSGDYVYTIPEDIILTDDGAIHQYRAIQGVIKDLKINNGTLITLDLIDGNNRVYFPDYNIAQNGIFIINKDAQESNEINSRSFWEQKDNLYVEQVNNSFYSFNVDIATNQCYVEFPIDIPQLIQGGLYIHYLVSNGKDGIIGIGQLNQLYESSVTATYLDDNSTITMNSDNLYIQNVDLVKSGKDPESIDNMYINYNHIKGTFDTLVTLRDYNNAIYNTEEVSNAVVCDRTNDVQQTYRIMAYTMDDSENVVYTQEADVKTYGTGQNAEDAGKITPFGLKVYALQYNDLVDTDSVDVNRSAYDNTFVMYQDLDVEDEFNIDSSLRQLVLLLNDDRCVQHDFLDIEPNKICLLKNIAEVSMIVFPTISLTEIQKKNVINDIRNQIYLKYNARKVDFGEQINYEDLFTNIITSNNLIKNISLNQIQYYTYVMYYSNEESGNIYGQDFILQNKWRSVCVSDEVDYIRLSIKSAYKNTQDVVCFDAIQGFSTDDIYYRNINIVDQFKGKNLYFIDEYGNIFYLNEDNNLVLYSTKRNDFRHEIVAKNILCGITPLFKEKENSFDYQSDENNTEITPVVSADVTSTMGFDFNGSTEATYYPKDNEIIQFVQPQLKNSVTYGAYIKYDYIGQTIYANQNHKLTADEQLIIYYKTDDSEESSYTRVIYGKNAVSEESKYPIVNPNFLLESTVQSGELQLLSNPTITPSTTRTCNASQSISIKQKNEVILDKNSRIYVLGSEYQDEDGIDYYKLVLTKLNSDENDKQYQITLQGEQQFIYSSSQLTYLNIVGSGTKITITAPQSYVGDTYTLSNQVVSTRNIQRFGVSALQGKWIPASQFIEVNILAQEFINVFGTADDSVDTNSDSFVKITSPSAMENNVILTRDGLFYSNSSNYVRTYSGTVEYVDDNLNQSVGNIAENNFVANSKDNFFNNFICNNNYYGESLTGDFSTNIALTPANYKQITIDYYDNEHNQASISGIKTSELVDGTKTYFYVISGVSLYYVCQDSSTSTTYVKQVECYQGARHSTATSITRGARNPDGTYVYTATFPSAVPATDSVFIISWCTNSATSSFEDNFQDFFAENLDYATTSDRKVFTFNRYAFSNTSSVTIVAGNFYQIYNISYDYQAGVQPGAVQYTDPLNQATPLNNNAFSEYVTLQLQNYLDNTDIRAVPLTFPNYVSYPTSRYVDTNEYYTWESQDVTFALAERRWEFQDIDGDTKYILDREFRENYFNEYTYPLVNRMLDSWEWPIENYTITITSTQDYTANLSNNLNPSLYTYTYKNRGGEITSIQLDQELDIGWSIYGYAYLDLKHDTPSRLYSNQILTVNNQNQDIIIQQSIDDENEKVYIYSSDDIYIEGFKKVNTQLIDSNGTLYYPTFLITEQNAINGYNKDIYNNKIITFTQNTQISTDYVQSIRNNWEFITQPGGDVLGYTQIQPIVNSIQVDINPSGQYADNYTIVDQPDISKFVNYIFTYDENGFITSFIPNFIKDNISITIQENSEQLDIDVPLNPIDFDLSSIQLSFDESNTYYVKEGGTQLETKLPLLQYYMFQIKNGQNLASFKFSYSSSVDDGEGGSGGNVFQIKCLNCDYADSSNSYWDLSKSGIYYFIVSPNSSISDSAQLNITFNVQIVQDISYNIYSDYSYSQYEQSVTKDDIIVEIYPMEVCDSDSVYLSSDYEGVMTILNELAYYEGRNIFNYFYQPPEDKRIENPLISTTFNNHNHFYNPYTICKIKTYDQFNNSNILINT